MTPASKEWVSDRQFGTWVAAAFGLSVVSPWRPLWAYRQDVSRETSGDRWRVPQSVFFDGSDLRPGQQRAIAICCFPESHTDHLRNYLGCRHQRMGTTGRPCPERCGALPGLVHRSGTESLQGPRPRHPGTGPPTRPHTKPQYADEIGIGRRTSSLL
jgi:hypothetical protein